MSKCIVWKRVTNFEHMKFSWKGKESTYIFYLYNVLTVADWQFYTKSSF